MRGTKPFPKSQWMTRKRHDKEIIYTGLGDSKPNVDYMNLTSEAQMKTTLLTITSVLLATLSALALTPAQIEEVANKCAADVPFSDTVFEDIQDCVDFNISIYPRYVSFKPSAYKGR